MQIKHFKNFWIFGLVAFALSISFYLNFKKNVIYLYPGFFSFEDKPNQDVVFYNQNLSELCRKLGCRLKITRTIDKTKLKNLYKLVIFDLENISRKHLKKYSSKRLILFLWEPPSTVDKNYQKKYHRFFSKIYTWNDKLIDGYKYFKFYYPEKKPMLAQKKPFSEKKLLAMMARYKHSKHPDALYKQRENAVKLLDHQEDFYLFGPAWDKKYRSYQGKAATKEVLRDFKFCLCYENIQNIHGYVTEKIFDAFHFGCVPVYLGADNIAEYIPANCFIDRKNFTSLEELYVYLKQMDENTYLQYLKKIENFLQTKHSYFFTPQYFAEIFRQAVLN